MYKCKCGCGCDCRYAKSCGYVWIFLKSIYLNIPEQWTGHSFVIVPMGGNPFVITVVLSDSWAAFLWFLFFPSKKLAWESKSTEGPQVAFHPPRTSSSPASASTWRRTDQRRWSTTRHRSRPARSTREC